MRRAVRTKRERRRTITVNTYATEALLDALRGSGFETATSRGDLPARISAREALVALDVERTPKALEAVRSAVKRQRIPAERARREIFDDARNRTMDVYVYDLRDALLAVAAQREAMLERLAKGSMSVAARTIETSIWDPQRNSRRTWSIATSEPFDRPERDLCIPPWLLGFWLGDGDHDNYQVTVGNEDRDVLVPMIASAWGGPVWIRELQGKVKVSLRTRDPESCFQGHPRPESGPCYTCLALYEYKGLHRPRPGINAPFVTLLRHAGVYKNKHIPAAYLRASASQRLALLQGLIDSDGHIANDGGMELALSDQRLASDSLELIRSLGIRASCTTGPTHRTARNGARIPGKDRHRIHFTTSRRVAALPRKASRLPVVHPDSPTRRRLFVVSAVTKHEVTELISITLDGPPRAFLVEGFLPVLDRPHG